MAVRSVGFRLGTEGKAEVVNDFKAVSTAGKSAMNDVAEAAESAAERSARASAEYTERQLASYKRQANAAKLAAAGVESRSTFDAALAQRGSGSQFAGVNLDRSTGAARSSASVFETDFRRQDEEAAAAAKRTADAEALAARAEEDRVAAVTKLRAALDPLSVLQAKFGQDVAQADQLLKAGSITTDEHASALKLYAQRLDDARKSLDGSARADADAEAAANRLRSALDPLWAAQKRYDQELASHANLLARGKITEEEHSSAVAKSKEALDEAKQALEGHGQAAGLSANQMAIAMHMARSFGEQLLYSGNIVQAATAQVGHMMSFLSLDQGGLAAMFGEAGKASEQSSGEIKEGSDKSSAALDGLKDKGREAAEQLVEEHGVGGALRKVTSLLTPMRVGVGLTAAAVALGAKAWLDYSDNVNKLQSLSIGSGALLGLDGAQLEDAAASAAKAGNMAVSAAREIEEVYIQSGNVTKDVLVDLTAATKDFAAATGQDTVSAAKQLDAALADPIKGAEDLAERYGWVNQATADYIAKLVEQNETEKAQRVLTDAVANATAGAANQANVLSRGWDNVKNSAKGAFEWLGKAIDRAAGGGAIEAQIAKLQGERARGPSTWQLITGTSTAEYQAGIDRQIADLRSQAQQAAARGTRNKEISDVAGGSAIVDRYTGADRLGEYRTTVGKLNAALATQSQLSPDQRKAYTDTLSAYTHAIDTFIPAQEKANKLADLDSQIARLKPGAHRAALETQRAEVAMAGQVITAADAERQAHDRGTASLGRARTAHNGHAQALAREAESMEVNTRGSLALADAYLKSSAAGYEAEARRKAATDATRKGISVEEQTRRQLNLQVAEAIANGAKSVSQLRDEAESRKAVLASVVAEMTPVADMNRALADEAALRPLIALRTVAQGDALTKLNEVIDAYRAKLADAHKAEDAFGLTKAMDESTDRIEELRASIADLNRTPLDRALSVANRSANRDADQMHLPASSDDRVKFVRQREREAETKYQADRAVYVRDTLDRQHDQLALSSRDLELAGASDAVRERELTKLSQELEIRRQFPDLAGEDLAKILAGVDAQEKVNAKLKIASAAWSEMRQAGEQFIDDLTNPDGSGLKNLLKDVERELLKLALINPLKNLLLGQKNTTIGSILGAIGGLGGLGGAKTPDYGGGVHEIGHNASGTQDWRGGLTWVGENGPELAELPSGTRITPAADARRLAGANDNGGAVHQHFYLDGAIVDQSLYAQMAAIGDNAALRGAAGGASISEAQTSARRARKLGRF